MAEMEQIICPENMLIRILTERFFLILASVILFHFRGVYPELVEGSQSLSAVAAAQAGFHRSVIFLSRFVLTL